MGTINSYFKSWTSYTRANMTEKSLIFSLILTHFFMSLTHKIMFYSNLILKTETHRDSQRLNGFSIGHTKVFFEKLPKM